jgi:hypothetical protein
MGAEAFIGWVGVMNIGVADVVGIFSIEQGLALFTFQLYICIYRCPFKDMAVIEERSPGTVAGLFVNLAAGEPVIGRDQVFQGVCAFALFFGVGVVKMWVRSNSGERVIFNTIPSININIMK